MLLVSLAPALPAAAALVPGLVPDAIADATDAHAVAAAMDCAVQYSGVRKPGAPYTDCACPGVCEQAGRRPKENCTEAVAECEPNVQFLDGVAVLESNPVYRVTDILTLQGMRWRLDATRTLCDARYRGTLLREVLRRTATLDGCLLDEDGYERAWCGTREGLLVSSLKAGWPRCMRQTAPERCRGFAGAGLEQALSGRSDAADGTPGHSRLTARGGASGLHFGGAVSFAWPFEAEVAVPTLASLQLETLYQVLSERQGVSETRCETADDATLVVPIRMGDFLPATPEEVMDNVLAVTRRFPTSLRRVLFTGVMHYGANEYLLAAPENEIQREGFRRTPQRDAINRDWLANLTARVVGAGLSWHIRSEPIADKDLCYLVYSPRVLLPPGRGFGVVISKLRRSSRLAANRVAKGVRKTLTCVAPEVRSPTGGPDWGAEWGSVHEDVTCYTDAAIDDPGDYRGEPTAQALGETDLV